MRIALFLFVILGIACVTAQQATIQSLLSTNQTLNLHWTCESPYATATDFQGVVYSSCADATGSRGILWTYRDSKGQLLTGWVTSPGNGSCSQARGLSVSGDGEYVYATCSGNPLGMQIIGYERQINVNGSINGSMWSYNPTPLNTSTWACGRDILFDSITEDIYAICGTTLTSTATRIIRFPHNDTTNSYMMPQDLGIRANYIKMNALNNYLYFANTSGLGWLVTHDDNGTALSMPNNTTWIPVNGTLTNYCEITSFTFSHNTTTFFVGCTGVHNLQTAYTSYSILRIDMNATWTNMTTNNSTINNNNSTINNSTANNGSINSNSSSMLAWSFTVMNITWTDSKAQGPDNSEDLSYPADGSCKGPSDMEVDSMNQLYVACMSNPELRSLIRYTQMNDTYYLPAYVNFPAPCRTPRTNSLTLTLEDDVIISCNNTNIGYLFGTMNNNTNNTGSSSSSSSSSSSTGTGFNGTSSSTGGTSITLPPTIPGFNGSSSSSTGIGFPNGTTSIFSSSSSSSGVVCVNGVCISSSSSTGIQTGRATNLHVNVAVFLVSLLLLVVFV